MKLSGLGVAVVVMVGASLMPSTGEAVSFTLDAAQHFSGPSGAASVVPEPASIALFGLSAIAMARRLRRQR